MKFAKILLTAGIVVGLLSGCGGGANKPTDNKTAGNKPAENNQTANQPNKGQTDVQTSASIVNEAAAFKKAVSKDGTWIIAILNDLTINEEVTVAGEFHDKGQADREVYRKIALYAQDADHNITASYMLTVPKLTVQSENLRIQGGMVMGDVYVEAKGFNLHETSSIEGNLYFANDEVKNAAKIDGKVTGATEVKK
ncbi:polymer-forming cytoskeletal protein [Paenibacillus turicensis]|uniref:polymer-forming cytoskeletal protein n=1 Tax=Paenibacillus turicensis TaxID=160487 RepID=UPI003D2695F0